jgi:DNA-binding HxlR family transcriptional regulator
VIRRVSWHLVQALLFALRGKWSLPVIEQLENGPRRFVDLLDAFDPPVSETSLNRALHALQERGLVAKETARVPGFAPAVQWALTSDARALLEPLRPVREWAADNGDLLARHAEELARSNSLPAEDL